MSNFDLHIINGSYNVVFDKDKRKGKSSWYMYIYTQMRHQSCSTSESYSMDYEVAQDSQARQIRNLQTRTKRQKLSRVTIADGL